VFVELKDGIEIDNITWTGSFTPICTIGKLPFMADITIEFSPKTQLLEYIAFEKAMKERLNGKDMIIEEIPSIILNDVIKDFDVYEISITVKAETTVHNKIEVSLLR